MKTHKQIHQKIETSEKAEDMASRWVKESVGDFILFCSIGSRGKTSLYTTCATCAISACSWLMLVKYDYKPKWMIKRILKDRHIPKEEHFANSGVFHPTCNGCHRLLDFMIWSVTVCFGSTLHPVTVEKWRFSSSWWLAFWVSSGSPKTWGLQYSLIVLKTN